MTNDADVPVHHQLDALLHGAGLFPRDDLVCLRVRGADRIDYLHRMLTQDVASITPGEATYACLLTIQGRVLGDLLIWDLGEHALLEMDRAAVAAVRPVLEKYVIADDVAFEEIEGERRRVTLAGPEAAGHLERAGFHLPPHGRHVVDHDVRVLRFDRRGLPCFEIDATEGALPDLPDVVPCSAEAWAAACVHAAIPRFGSELGEDVLLNEAGLEEAVSWSKGCYPGQEPVMMAKHRGHPPRLLVKLDIEGDPPLHGAAVRADGTAVGQVTASAAAVGERPAAALAYVKHADARAGRVLDVDGGGRGTASLPSA
jgi:folate-binding protein YgfZ